MDLTNLYFKQHWIKLKHVYVVRRFLSTTTAGAGVKVAVPEEENINIKKTVFLPKTTFPPHLKSTERSAVDAELHKQGKFDDFYLWQRDAAERKHLPE